MTAVLDDRGRRDAAEIGGWISRHPPFPDHVLVSPATQPHQTWDAAWEAMKNLVSQPQVQFSPNSTARIEAPLANHPHGVRVRSQAADAGRAQSGHAQTALTLTGSSDSCHKKALDHNLPTSGLAIFDFATHDWNEVAFRRGKLVLFVSPKLLKQTSGDWRESGHRGAGML